jgi:hypothetical protein
MKKEFKELEELRLKESLSIPSNYVKIRDVIDDYAPTLLATIMMLTIKKDGSIDVISDREYKHVDSILDFYINIDAQRVQDIVESKITENLKETGGFSHETSGSLSVFISQKYGIRIVTDGMHRLIKAFLCGVDELAYSIEKVMPEDMTDKEMTTCEYEFLKAKNSRNAQMSTTEQNRVAKASGNMSEKQKFYDETFKKAGIHVNGYGAAADITTPTYTAGHEDWDRHLRVESSAYHVGITDFCNHSYKPLIKFGTRNCSIDIPISWILVNIPSIRNSFLTWLGSDDFLNKNQAWWFRYAMHGRSIETTIVRLLCAFNEQYRNSHEKNIIFVEMISFLNTTSLETKHFAINCLDRKISIIEAEERSKDSEVARLNKILGID